MNKKVTRRVVLGTAIAGLVVAPFVAHHFRKRQKPLPAPFAEPYGKVELPFEMVNSKLSSEELQIHSSKSARKGIGYLFAKRGILFGLVDCIADIWGLQWSLP